MRTTGFLGRVVPILALAVSASRLCAADPDAADIVRRAFDAYRGQASVATFEMSIHRPEWSRTFVMRGWTRGQRDSLVRTLEPPKDADNATLKRGREMWVYNPQVNRVIKLPPSMMAQSWMGSDFSNEDLAKSDSILLDYTHELIGRDRHEGKAVHLIRSIPKPRAPVVWGKQEMKIREDDLFLEVTYYDEDLRPVKILSSADFRPVSGRLYPHRMTMRQVGGAERYTRLVYRRIEFPESLPDSLFSLSQLHSP